MKKSSYESVMERGGDDDLPPAMMPPPSTNPAFSTSQPATRTPDVDDVDSSEKICRICLQSDDMPNMIAPCHCRGSSKWVHRACLDLWRTHETDRAFSQCTECGASYILQHNKHKQLQRRAKFCLFVSRDICFVTIIVQLVIGLTGWLIYLLDRRNQQLLQIFGACNNDSSSSSWWWCQNVLAAYYTAGLIVALAGLGVFGSIVLCRNGCKIPDLDNNGDGTQQQQPSNTATTTTTSAPSHDYYSAMQQGRDEEQQQQQSRSNSTYHRSSTPHYYYGRRRRYYRHDHCCQECCLLCDNCFYHNYYCCFYDCCPNTSNRGGSSSGDCDGCGDDGCCDCLGRSHSGYCSSSNGGGDGDSGGSGDNTAHVFLMILLVVVIVLAVIGFFVGIFLAVLIGQHIFQRHLFLLEKKRLAEEYPVQDLSGYSDLAVLPAPPVSYQDVVPLPPPVALEPLDETDVSRLQKLGLME